MEAIRSSETSGTTQRTTWRHIPEEDTLQNHRSENLKSYKYLFDLNLKISDIFHRLTFIETTTLRKCINFSFFLMAFHLSIQLIRNLAGHNVLLILRNPGGTCRNICG
jgi:hypothetical protein